MTKEIIFRRGPHSAFTETPDDGEPVWTNGSSTFDGRLWIGNGTAVSGVQVGWPYSHNPGWKSGYYYNSALPLTAYVTASTTANIVSYSPIHIGGGVRAANGASTQSLHVNVIGAASGNLRMAIYDNDNGEPGDLLFESGAISTSTTGLKTWSLSRTFIGGWYWLAFNTDTSSATFTCIDNLAVAGGILGDSVLPLSIDNAYYQVHAFGAFPASATLVGSVSIDYPAVVVRAA